MNLQDVVTFCFGDKVQMLKSTYDSIVWKHITEDDYAGLSEENKANYVFNETSYSGSGPMYTLKQTLNSNGAIMYDKLLSNEEYEKLEDNIKLNYKRAHKMYSHVPIPLQEMEDAYVTYINEIKPLSELRAKRDTLLRESDIYSLPDYPHPTEEAKQAWLDYRQALRDLPANTEDPNNIDWPRRPDEPVVP